MVLVSSCLCNIWKNHMMFQILDSGEQINLQHFRPIKPLGSGDTGRFVLIFSFFPCCHLNFTYSYSEVIIFPWVELINLFELLMGMAVCIWLNCADPGSTLPWKPWTRVLCSTAIRYSNLLSFSSFLSILKMRNYFEYFSSYTSVALVTYVYHDYYSATGAQGLCRERNSWYARPPICSRIICFLSG